MYKSKSAKVWKAPVALFVISTLCNALIILYNCPQILNNRSVWYGKEKCEELKIEGCGTCDAFYMPQLYIKTYTRMSPYAFGIWTAYLHLKEVAMSK